MGYIIINNMSIFNVTNIIDDPEEWIIEKYLLAFEEV
jgi:hypothetical protein